MSFTGKYQLERQEGFVPFMKAIGLPDDLIEKGKDIKSITEIEQNGDCFKVTITTGSNVVVNSFTIGEECEVNTVTGDKIKAVILKEGNKLKTNLKSVESVTELLDPNTLVNTMTLGDIVFKGISKRMS